MPDVSIKVVARFRPRNKIEAMKNDNPREVIWLNDDQKSISIQEDPNNKPKLYNFDLVFPTSTNQISMFDLVGKEIVDNCLAGFNSTLFAYGQTGAGKTFSLVGKLDNPDLFGIIPRAGSYLFDHIENDSSITDFAIQMMVFEVYCEKLQDCLNPGGPELKVRQKRSGATYIENVKSEYVKNLDEVFSLMTIGFSNRATAATGMNAESSRSHCIFCFMIKTTNTTGQVKEGRLYICDLAGSERVSKTGATGQIFEEAKAINGSLTALGNVIGALSSGKSGHVPFRDSVLTFLLKDSLQGNTKTVLLVAATLDDWNLEETISTMRFAARAKMIKNSVKSNKNYSAAQLKKIVAAQKKQIIDCVTLCHQVMAADYEEGKCAAPTVEILEALKAALGEDMPAEGAELVEKEFVEREAKADDDEDGEIGIDDEEADKPAAPAKAAKAKGEDGDIFDNDDDEDGSDIFDDDEDDDVADAAIAKMMGGGVDLDALEAQANTEIAEYKEKIATLKIESMKLTHEIEDCDKNKKSSEKDVKFYKRELAARPPPPPSARLKKNDDESLDIVAKLKRDLRVYKYTLDLTRQEWSKNQKLALEKMQAHRNVIGKYRSDKQMLLGLVTELEAKITEANRRLSVGSRAQKRANEMLKKFTNAREAINHLDKDKTNALAAFKKSGNKSRASKIISQRPKKPSKPGKPSRPSKPKGRK